MSLQVRAGEILGIAGIDGNGQEELVYGLTGLSKVVNGKILINGKDITHKNIKTVIKKVWDIFQQTVINMG